jgi:tryptophan synthase beta chain
MKIKNSIINCKEKDEIKMNKIKKNESKMNELKINEMKKNESKMNELKRNEIKMNKIKEINNSVKDDLDYKFEYQSNGFFGEFGGAFVPDVLKPYLKELEKYYLEYASSKEFQTELDCLLKDFVGRPSPLFHAKKLSKIIGAKVYLKREDLNHTGSHKINNTLAQALIAKKMGVKEIIAETGAGQHGVATATAASLLGLKCKVFMGEIDANKQRSNVYRMQLLGAEVNVVKTGGRVLKDAVDEAINYLVRNPKCFYLLGSVVGPHPYPIMVRNFQKIIGREAKEQILRVEGKMPDYLIACIGGGSNAMGLFYEFFNEEKIEFIAVEPAGKGLETGEHAATLTFGIPGIIHGFKCLLLQDIKGEPKEVYSIASGLDYPGVSPEASFLRQKDIIQVGTVDDREALLGFNILSREEGIIPALESSHAIGYLLKHKDKFKDDDVIVLNLSGRGDKDVETVLDILNHN